MNNYKTGQNCEGDQVRNSFSLAVWKDYLDGDRGDEWGGGEVGNDSSNGPDGLNY